MFRWNLKTKFKSAVISSIIPSTENMWHIKLSEWRFQSAQKYPQVVYILQTWWGTQRQYGTKSLPSRCFFILKMKWFNSTGHWVTCKHDRVQSNPWEVENHWRSHHWRGWGLFWAWEFRSRTDRGMNINLELGMWARAPAAIICHWDYQAPLVLFK